jgi:amino acid transporter
MKLTKNSWHYNAYSFLTGKTPNNNFCDYFWELLFNLVLFIPNIPFYIVTAIFSKFEKTYDWDIDTNNNWIKTPKSYEDKLKSNNKIPLWVKLCCSALISIVLGVVAYWLIFYTMKLITIVALLTVAVLLIIGVVYYFIHSSTPERIKDNIVEFFSMIEEAFYSFKDNYCPKINWED